MDAERLAGVLCVSGKVGHIQSSPSLPAHILQEVFGRNNNHAQGAEMPRMPSSCFHKTGGTPTQRFTDEDLGGDEERS